MNNVRILNKKAYINEQATLKHKESTVRVFLKQSYIISVGISTYFQKNCSRFDKLIFVRK